MTDDRKRLPSSISIGSFWSDVTLNIKNKPYSSAQRRLGVNGHNI
jgi:hypothetical protein